LSPSFRSFQEYLFERKVKATDRTKTPEEIAKEEAEKLHELETRRLARMNGDFDEDDLSDISDDEEGGASGGKKRRREKKDKKLKAKKKQRGESGGDDLGDSDDDDDKKDDDHEVRFTADGLVYVDKEGKVVGKVGEEVQDEGSDDESDENESDESNVESEDGSDSVSGSDDDGSDYDDDVEFTEGMKIQGNYHASEQYQGKKNWYDGTITAIRTDNAGNTLYDVTYDDGDFEEGMAGENVRPAPLSKEEKDQQTTEETEAAVAKKRKQKAKLRAK